MFRLTLWIVVILSAMLWGFDSHAVAGSTHEFPVEEQKTCNRG